jgi:putative peptide zinc metalloprotease protein
MDAHDRPAPLRPDLRIRKIVQNGELRYIVKDPDKQEYFSFDPDQHKILSMMNGVDDLHKLLGRFNQQSKNEQYDLGSLEELVQSARDFDLLKRSQREENAALLERLKQERQKKILQGKGSLLWMRYQLVDPNAFFDRIIDSIRFFWQPRGVKSCLALVMSAVVLVLLHLDRFQADFDRVYFAAHQGALGALGIWCVALGAIALHECGHGLTCKNYGGEVHEMGFLLLAFQPCLYCNVNDAWLFPEKRHKIYVALAGVWVEILLGSLAAWVWFFVDVGNPVGRIAYILMTISTASSLLVNLNPLLRFDGYYMLTDLLEVPNLRQNSLAIFSWSIKTKLLGMDEPPPFVASARENRTYLIYGMLTVSWLTLLLSFVAVLGYGMIKAAFGFWGILCFVYLVSKILRMLLGSWPKTVREMVGEMLWSSPRKKIVTLCVSALACVLMVWWSPPVKVHSEGKIEAEHFVVRAPENALVEDVSYTPQRTLVPREDGLLVQLSSPELKLKVDQVRSKLGVLELNRNAAIAQGDRVSLSEVGILIDAARAQLDDLQARTRKLLIYQPSGQWRVEGPPPQTVMGRYFQKGEKILDLVPEKKRKLVVVVQQSDVSLVAAKQQALVQVGNHFPTTYLGEVSRIKPLPTREGPERLFEVEMDLTIETHAPAPYLGMMGEATILTLNQPLWRHVVRYIRGFFRTDLWL